MHGTCRHVGDLSRSGIRYAASVVVLCLAVAPAYADSLRVCTGAERMVRSIRGDDAGDHRRQFLPVLAYVEGAQRMRAVNLDVYVDASGHTTCHVPSTGLDALDEAHRRWLLEQASAWAYVPFRQHGVAAPVVVQERILPVAVPARHLRLPEVSMKTVKLRLIRHGCLAACPDYDVEVRGDGRVTYVGHIGVDVEGSHAWRIHPSEVAALVRSARDNDLWSLKSDYGTGMPDAPSNRIEIDMGGQVHTIDESDGRLAGMPASVTAFENEIDRLSGASSWTRLSTTTLEQLQATGLRLDSKDAGRLLARVVGHDDTADDAAARRLIEGGAPIDDERRSDGVLHFALLNRRRALVPALLARGALQVGGRLDQAKLDAAFRDAIRGGDVSLVEAIWDAGGHQRRPALTQGEDASSIVLPPADRDGFAIARWLVSHGVDLKAPGGYGDTWLHVAARSGDVAFVRYLLSQGFDVNSPGDEFSPPIYATQDEDVALALLDAGANSSLYVRSGYSLRRIAMEARWWRVLAWLDAHPRSPG